MTIVSAMMLLLFCLLYYFTGRNLERESMQMMAGIAMNPLHMEMPIDANEEVRLPYFVVSINHAGERTEQSGGFFDLSDEELLDRVVQETYNTHTSSGTLQEYKLRFFRAQTPQGECIVFSDMTSEKATLRNLLRTFLMIGGIGFLGFLGISILLAYWAVRPVEEAWMKQKQFVADASHELKTPLTVIMTDAELICQPDCPMEEKAQLAANVLTMSKHMRHLVEHMLELARMDSGAMKEKQERINVSQVFSDEAMLFEPLFFEKNLLFTYQVTPDIAMNGNATQMKQLVDILLDNAAKYSTPGGKTRLFFSMTNKKKCRLEVENQGSPIDEEDMKHLFKRFYRVDTSRTGGSGFGLGLSIALGIVNDHNGKIWGESVGGYNRFFAEFPIIHENKKPKG